MSVFPLSCNFYVPDVNFTGVNEIKARYKLSNLRVNLSDRGSNFHVYERPFIHCLYFICE